MTTTEMTTTRRQEVVGIVTTTPAVVFSDPSVARDFIAGIEAEVDAFKPDMATDKGRRECASLAFKVTRTKTAIDAAGASLIEDANAKIKAVNGERRKFRDTFDALRDRARKPLTDWEEAEQAREAACKRLLVDIRNAGIVTPADTSATVQVRWTELDGMTLLAEPVLRERLGEARQALDDAKANLQREFARLKQNEADLAELQRLRAENAAREAAEAKAASEKKRQEREAAAAEAERKRIEDAATEAARAAERAAIAAAEERERELQREIDAGKERERQRVDAENRAAAEAAQRAADQDNRQKVLGAAASAMIAAVPRLSQASADKLVLAIAAGSIPGVSIRF